MRHLKGLEFERPEALKIKVFGLSTWIDMEGEIKVLGSSAVRLFSSFIAIPFPSAYWHIPISLYYIPSFPCCYLGIPKGHDFKKLSFPQSHIFKGWSGFVCHLFLMLFSGVIFMSPSGPLPLPSSPVHFLLTLMNFL